MFALFLYSALGILSWPLRHDIKLGGVLLSGTYFLIPLYSLIPGNLSAFVLLVISLFWAQCLSSWIRKIVGSYHYGIVNMCQKCKATC